MWDQGNKETQRVGRVGYVSALGRQLGFGVKTNHALMESWFLSIPEQVFGQQDTGLPGMAVRSNTHLPTPVKW